MKSFKRILVALDLSTMDDELIPYSLWFAKSVKAEKVYFIYCAQELRELNEYSSKNEEGQPLGESIREHFSKAIKKHKLSKGLVHEIIVDQIMPLEGMLYWGEVKKIDLLVVGKKKRSSGSGVISKQFVRHSDCPVLFVPENAEMTMNKILVPIDFSENSSLAVQQSLNLQPYFGNPEITCLNVFFAPPEEYGGHEIGFYANMRKTAVAEKYQQFISPIYENGKNIKPLFIPDNEFKTIEIILEAAKEKQAGLIIIGAIGHSKIKLLTVGSTAEKMMLSDFSMPLLIIRKQV